LTQDIHIVAVGARTPLGLNAESSFAAVRAGISQINEYPIILDKVNQPVRLALDHALKQTLEGPERLIRMATSALEEICTMINFNQLGIQEIALFVALPEERPGWGKNDIQAVKTKLLQLSLPVKFCSIDLLPNGHAAGIVALNMAIARIKDRPSEMCIVLGVDSYLNFETLEWLDNNKQLANSYNRGAFFPGEGAGAVLIGSNNVASRYKMDSFASIRGVGSALETKTIKTDTICLGEGLTKCVREATKSLQIPEQAIDCIICDINGERYRAEEWGFVMLRCAEAFVDPTEYEQPATCWGDVGAASGPLFIGLAVTAGKRGWAKGKRYMIWNSSEGGYRAAVLLEINGIAKGVNDECECKRTQNPDYQRE
jgi:3-oxoacyl-[acyl-carrier-protein] synthase-1